MYCNKCGSQLEPENKFCTKCGAPRKVESQEPITMPINRYQSTLQNSGQLPKTKIKINKNILSISILSLFIIIISIAVFINIKPNKNNNITAGTRTIIIYMIGSDLESKYGYAASDIKEMLASKPNLTDNNIIIYTGGARKWSNGFNNNAIYEMTENEFKLVKQDEQMSMANDITLTNFLDYVYENYQSDLYDLFFWDHGAGPILGFGSDELDNKNSLAIEEIDLALKNSKLTKNTKLEIIGFDACLMASIEIAKTLSQYADYLVSSQETEPGFGWDYAFLKDINHTTDSKTFGISIIDNYYKFYELLGYDEYVALTLSLVDLTKINQVELRINNLFADVDTYLSNGGYSTIVNQITKSKCFQCDGFDSSYDLIDLYGAVIELKSNHNEKATDLLRALEDTVIYQKTNVIGANGLSIYYPYYTKKYLDNWLSVYNNLDFAKNYQTFITNYTKTLTGEKIADFNLKNTIPAISEDKNNISIKLDENARANYHKSRYIIFKDTKDGHYSPVFSSSDTTLKDDGTLIANFKKQELNIIDEQGEKSGIIGHEYERTSNYVIYQINVILGNYHPSDGSLWEHQSAAMLLKVDARHPNGQIIGVVPTADISDNTSIKKNIDLNEWETIEFWNWRYKIFDDYNKFTWDWVSASSQHGYEVKTTENYSIKFQDLEADFDYICIFFVSDTQGNQYITNPVKIAK